MHEPIDTPGIYTDITEIDYHADPVKDGSLSSTGCRLILRSPAHYKAAQEHPEYKDEFDFGSAGAVPVVGDWNGDGVDSPGTFQAGSWSLTNSFGGSVETQFTFGTAGDRPVVWRRR